MPQHVVSRRLGHANITVTLGLYAHLLPGDRRDGAATVAGLVLGSPGVREHSVITVPAA